MWDQFYKKKIASAVINEALGDWDSRRFRSYTRLFTVDEVKKLLIQRFQKIKSHNYFQYPEVEELVLYFFSEVHYEEVTDYCNHIFQKMHEEKEFDVDQY